MAEDRVRHILMDVKLSKVKDFLEKNRAIDCVFLQYLGKRRWKDAKEFMNSINHPIDDGTFRARMTELIFLFLRAQRGIDPLRKYYEKNEMDQILAELLLEFFEKIEDEIHKKSSTH